MPGVLSANSNCDFSREVGKMAFMSTDLMNITDDIPVDLEDIDVETTFDFLLSENIADFADSDSDLPDSEPRVDLIKFLDSHHDMDAHPKLHRIKCDDACNSCTESPHKYEKYRVSEQTDPFMGMAEDSGRPCTMLEQLMSPLDYESEGDEQIRQKAKDTKIFSAWNTPPKTEEPDFLSPKSSVAWCGVFQDESSQEVHFPETPSPSTQSETVPGDDSDVDIETVTEAPRSIDSFGYSTSESSPSVSPSGSPRPHKKLQSGSLLTILSKSVSSNGRIRADSSSSFTDILSSSVSQADNLMSSTSHLLGQKRKLAKERKFSLKTHVQTSYQHVLCSSNSINFHDYAMSPGASSYSLASPSSTETGKPTILSKRIYKRKQFIMDASEKEKQHHHNQLERNRRQKLADLFVDLRDEVPKIASQAKASKVLILNEATVYIRELQRQERHQEDDISKELRKKEVLRAQLRRLQAQISNSVH